MIRERLTMADKYFSSLSLGSPADDAEALSHNTILCDVDKRLTLSHLGYGAHEHLHQVLELA